MFRPPTKYSEYLQDVRKSIDYILKRVNATTVTQIVAGTNVTISPASGTGVVTINASGGGGGGLPAGGTTGQILAKINNVDYNAEWIDNYALWTSTVKHEVKAGEAINKGQAVYVSSADGTNMIVSKASNALEATSSKTLGILAQSLAHNAKGFVITEGLLAGLDTSAAGAAGDPVWLGTDGNLLFGLANKPYAPANMVSIGVVTRKNSSNGEIFIRIQNGFELDELHNVDARNPNNNDGIFYNSTTQLWEHKPVSAVYATPTLAQVTTAGNTTTNAITVGGLTVATNLIYTDTVNGRVGIGTTTPIEKVDIATSADNQFALVLKSVTGRINFKPYLNATYGALIESTNLAKTAYNPLTLSGSKMLMLDGNVIIGATTDDGFKLSVNGTARVQGILTSTANINGLTVSNNNSNPVIGSDGTNVIIGSNQAYRIVFTSNRIDFKVSDGTNAINAGSFTSSGSLYVGGNAATTAKLQVSGSITAASALAQGVYFNNTLVAAANNDVLVGLDINPTFTNGAFTGVTNYALRLTNSPAFFGGDPVAMFITNNASIRGNATTGGILYIDGSRDLTGTIRLRATTVDIPGAASIGTLTSTAITVSSTNTVSLVTGTGVTSFRIGNTTSSSIWYFENNRNAPAGSLEITNSISSPGMTFFSSRNVAINSNTDSGYKLDVVGADSRFNGVRVGIGAGGVSTNTVVGTNALANNTTGLSNTAVGNGSLRYNIDGAYNTAYGVDSLNANTGGGSNVAVGWRALISSLTAYSNVAIGTQALFSNTASNNTAVGTQAAYSNTTGTEITAIGDRALYNSTGSSNTAIGAIALYTNTTGIQNTAVGRAALQSNTAGGTNTAVGYNALFSNLTGNSNTAIGWRSLNSNTGSNNIALGYEAGFAGVANTTGANNIFIGYQATGVSATESNRTWIGNSSTTSTWVGGNLLVGTTTNAGAKVQIKGSGNTSATTSLLVQNSSGTNALKIADDALSFYYGTFGVVQQHFYSNNGSGAKRWSDSYSIIDYTRGYGDSFLIYGGHTANYTFEIKDGFWTKVRYPLCVSTSFNIPNASAILQADSTTQGFLQPRMTNAQALAITTPATGLQVYDTTNNKNLLYNGTAWQNIAIETWLTSGSNIYYNTGNVGIGTTTPTDKFHIVDNTNGNKFGRISAGGTDASAAWVAQNDQVDNIVYRVFGSAVTGSQMGQALARSASLIANLGGTGKFLIGSYSGTDLIFGTSDQARMRLVDATGNFLIGTMTDNGNKLTVSGNIDAQGYKVNNVLGYTGILNIPTNPPGQQNIDIQGGIVVNIF